MTNCRKLFCYGVKRDHYDKFIGIRELLEQVAMDCFSNNFTTDIGTPAKNILSLDEIDKKGTVSTCWILNHSSSHP